jgi:PEP-CTERM motif-containing protein
MFRLRLLIFGLCAFVPVIALHEYERRSLASHSIKRHVSTQGAVIPPAARSLRPNYPYSVVPGGVYSPDELRGATKKDSLVREHYSDFNVHSARLVKLTEDQYQYASFRLGNRIFWTRNKLRIPKGEVLVTDGNSYARTRCGNRLSDVPNSNTTSLQPPDRLLSLPPFSLELVPEISFVEPPSMPELPGVPLGPPQLALYFPAVPPRPLQTAANWPPLQQPPSFVSSSTPPYATTPLGPNYSGGPGPSSSPPVFPPATPPVAPPVPEPGTLSLFGAGLLVSLLLLRRISHQARP